MKNPRLAWPLLAVVLLLLVPLDCARAQDPPPPWNTSTRLSDAEREQLTRRAQQLQQEFLQLREQEHADAAKILGQLLPIYESLYPETQFPLGHPDLALCLQGMGMMLHLQGRLRLAQEYCERAIRMYERLYPKERIPQGHPGLATSLYTLGRVIHDQGKHEQAREYLKRSLAMHERLYPQGHPRLAEVLKGLGDVLLVEGDFRWAQRYIMRALVMNRRLYPTSQYPQGHPVLVSNLKGLGNVLALQGEYDQARECLEQAFAMQKRLYPQAQYPQGHPNLVFALISLGLQLLDQGEYERAREYCEQAVAMCQRLYPKRRYPQGHDDTASALNTVGIVLSRQAEYEQAQQYHERALTIYENLYPESRYPQGHPSLHIALVSLGANLLQQGDHKGARKRLERALAMCQRLYPKRQSLQGRFTFAATLGKLSDVLDAQGEHEQAREHREHALAMWQGLYPRDQYPQGHPVLSKVLYTMAQARLSQGVSEPADGLLQRAIGMQEDLAVSFLTDASEAEALNFAAQSLGVPHLLLSAWRDAGKLVEESYTHVWMRRGLIQRLIARRQRLIQQSTTPDVQVRYEKYLRIRRMLARLTLAPADLRPGQAGERSRRLRELSDQKERLERELADTLPEFRRQLLQQRRPHTDLVEHLPQGTVFIDLLHYLYLQHDPKIPGKAGWNETPSYVAFLLQPGRPVLRIELGPAEPIDNAVKTWREDIALLRPSSAPDVLRRLVWEPLEKHLPSGTNIVYLCADGVLTSVPWPALSGRKKGTVLLDDYAFALVPHGQFLLEQLTAQDSTEDQEGVLLAVGGVAYDDRPSTTAHPMTLVARAAAVGDRDIRWPPLPATKHELDELEKAAGKRGVSILTGRDASTSRVLSELPKARWAHFATHGFFADPKIRSALQLDEKDFERRQLFLTGERTTVVGRNLLVLSGLVFAGANLPWPKDEFGISQGDGGILTAEAIAGLPLRDLELAVLSACDTGLGDVAGGEGVFGLQRAFHIAGARNVIASLWKVDDQPTAALMRLFYHKLWVEKKPPIVALRESQLALYRNPDKIGDLATTRGPVFDKVVELVDPSKSQPSQKTAPTKVWAAFILSGAGR